MSYLLSATYKDFPNSRPSWLKFCKSILFINSTTILLLFRCLSSMKTARMGGGKKLLFQMLSKRYSICCSVLNVTLPISTKIGEGLIFPHAFPLVINPEAIIGKNCIIHPCVLIGRDRGKDGAPIIGDNVFIGHGAKVIGNPHIGDWTFISPAAIITKDIPKGCLVGAGVNNIINNNGREHVMLYLPKDYQK